MESLDKVRKMLERFYQGESSLEEERLLEQYFSSTAVPEEMLPDRELFQALRTEEDPVIIPEGLNDRIIGVLDREERKEQRSRRISLYSLSGLAAGILALIAVYVFFLRTDDPGLLASQEQVDTYSDPQDAYEEAKRTLAYVSQKLNQGTSGLDHMKQAGRTSSQSMRSLSKINKANKELVLLGQLQRVKEIDN
jgi:hypothetical protein